MWAFDQLAHRRFAQMPGFGDAGDLDQRRGRSDVGIEAAGRAGHQIHRHRHRRVFSVQRGGVALDAGDQRFRRRPIIRGRRIVSGIGTEIVLLASFGSGSDVADSLP